MSETVYARRTVPFVPGTDLGSLIASIRPGSAPGAWHRLRPCLLASDLAPHRVPGTDLGPCLLASDLAPHRVPGTDVGPLGSHKQRGDCPRLLAKTLTIQCRCRVLRCRTTFVRSQAATTSGRLRRWHPVHRPRKTSAQVKVNKSWRSYLAHPGRHSRPGSPSGSRRTNHPEGRASPASVHPSVRASSASWFQDHAAQDFSL